jgi:hypothetical protein
MPPGVTRTTLTRNQDRCRRPLVNEDDFPDPERLSSTGAPKKIRSRDPSGLEGARHRSRGFATSDPASDARSPLQRSRAEELDPHPLSGDSSSPGVRGHAPPVDFCNRYDPRAQPGPPKLRMTSPAVARERSHSRDHDLSVVALSCEWLHSLRSAASRDVTGQGLHQGQLASVRHLPPRSLAVKSFAPTRSARTPHVAARDERRLEWPASWTSFRYVTHERA